MIHHHIKCISAIKVSNRVLTKYVDQTLTCEIGELTKPVRVTWWNYIDYDITEDTHGFTLNQGTVDKNGIQTATMTVTAEQLEIYVANWGTFTVWACQVQSTLFPESNIERAEFEVQFPNFGK